MVCNNVIGKVQIHYYKYIIKAFKVKLFFSVLLSFAPLSNFLARMNFLLMFPESVDHLQRGVELVPRPQVCRRGLGLEQLSADATAQREKAAGNEDRQQRGGGKNHVWPFHGRCHILYHYAKFAILDFV
jgi:hypothetical protein